MGDTEKSAKLAEYQAYLDNLCQYLPSYDKLRRFLARSNCRCGGFRGKHTCKCGDPGKSCECDGSGGSCICTEPETCKYCPDGEDCIHQVIQDTVRVYDIYPNREGSQLQQTTCHTSNSTEFKNLQDMLSSDSIEDGEPDDEDGESQGRGRQKQDDLEAEDRRYRLITVSHINPKVAKLLGSTYNISADFFNRHLPGTEALSGRLISRLFSCVQVEFDELYESLHPFSKYWGTRDAQEGHDIIRKAMDHYLLFRPGWDYFPVSQPDFDASLGNSQLSSGFEVIDDPKGSEKPQNNFQFNMSHRISIYSRPPNQSRTAIIIFYPTLPLFHDGSALNCPNPSADPGMEQKHCHYKDCSDKCNLVHFKAIPDSVPGFRAISNTDPQSSQVLQLLEADRFKQDYASVFDRLFQHHVYSALRRYRKRQDIVGVNFVSTGDETIVGILRAPHNTGREKRFDESKFVHLFMAPLFRMVASNWARLVVRRSFDLDLLEWRPKYHVTSDTINETKSRRISIARHRRDINSSVEILKTLMLEEQNQKLTREELEHPNAEKATQVLSLSEAESGWNRGRSNGLVSESAKPDSWERIYWDFFELKAQMDALEDRANKIQEGIVGLISVTQSENAGRLNLVAFIFSVVLLPFSIIGSIYGANISPGGPSKHVGTFKNAVLITFAIAVITFILFLWFSARLLLFISTSREMVNDARLRAWLRLRGYGKKKFSPPEPTAQKQRTSELDNV